MRGHNPVRIRTSSLFGKKRLQNEEITNSHCRKDLDGIVLISGGYLDSNFPTLLFCPWRRLINRNIRWCHCLLINVCTSLLPIGKFIVILLCSWEEIFHIRHIIGVNNHYPKQHWQSWWASPSSTWQCNRAFNRYELKKVLQQYYDISLLVEVAK